MDVLQVHKYYHPHVGGIESHVKTVAEGLAADGYGTSVLASTRRGRGGLFEIGGVDVRKASSVGEVLSVPLAPAFPVRLRRCSQDRDVVHFHLPDPLSVTAQSVAGRRDVGTVATYHSDIVRQSRALRVYAPVLRRFLASVDEIVVSSPRILEHSVFLAPHAEKCTVIPFGVDVERFRSPPESSGDIAEGRPTVLFVGRLVYYKGLDVLLEAVQDVDANLRIVGDGPLRGRLERYVATNGLSEDVTFLGRVSDTELRAAYFDADVFVLPSNEPSEAFGIAQLEAMAAGLPVVNTDLPTGVPWVSQDGVTGRTVPPGDADALAGALTELLGDPERRREYGRQARKRVQERFTEARMVADIEDVYERAADG